jgi:hypothetical protein
MQLNYVYPMHNMLSATCFHYVISAIDKYFAKWPIKQNILLPEAEYIHLKPSPQQIVTFCIVFGKPTEEASYTV